MIIDFSNPWVFIVWYAITAGLLFTAYKLKKSKLCLVPVFYFLLILELSVVFSKAIDELLMHRFFNFLGLIVSLAFFVVLDEVETRRKVISQVFKNRYKKKKLPSEMTEEELEELENEDNNE